MSYIESAKQDEFNKLVVKAQNNLRGDCPLVEDEAIIWADERIAELEARISKALTLLNDVDATGYDVMQALEGIKL